MLSEIPEEQFLTTLRSGIQRTKDFIDELTEYRGGAVRTEYILTADIARAFVEKKFPVKVECLNRKLVNVLTALKGTDTEGLGSKRTDVAILGAGLVPLAMIEVKIRVSSLAAIEGDLNKIANTIGMMSEKYAANVIGAVVFQVHVGSSTLYHFNEFKDAVVAVENSLADELKRYASSRPEFHFTMHPLQSADDGIAGCEVEKDFDGEEMWGAPGHATRYHAVLMRKPRVGFPFKLHEAGG